MDLWALLLTISTTQNHMPSGNHFSVSSEEQQQGQFSQGGGGWEKKGSREAVDVFAKDMGRRKNR